jgi:large subunit ribosomal protein L18
LFFIESVLIVALSKKEKKRSERRKLRVRTKLRMVSTLPRVSVFRSLKHIYAQIIDDEQRKTLTNFSSLELKASSGDKEDIARAVGKALADRAKTKGIEAVCFDRGNYLYHGRVKALAEGLREGGIVL